MNVRKIKFFKYEILVNYVVLLHLAIKRPVNSEIGGSQNVRNIILSKFLI